MRMGGEVKEISVPLPHPALPGSDWADAYQIVVEQTYASAREAGDAIIASFPSWTSSALALRQVLVTPFGLKGPADEARAEDRLGIFPVCAETTNQLVAGIDDKHLDFRIIIDLKELDTGQSVTLTTAIKRHNFLGRSYLLAVMPFHRQIISSALTKLAK
ncbi:MAG: DUF2867 domain-containing protein [Pseudomonadota bacterium]